MNTIYRRILVILTLLSFQVTPLYADPIDNSNQVITDNSGDKSDDLDKHLVNMGAYIGYDLTQKPEAKTVSSFLVNMTAKLLGVSVNGAGGQNQTSSEPTVYSVLFDVFLGSIPVNSTFKNFVPDGSEAFSKINKFSNATFKSYGSESPDQKTKLSINTFIDQKANKKYQDDPVNQALFNMLATPDASVCIKDGKWLESDECKNLLYNTRIKSIVTNGIPQANDYYKADYIETFLSQLNSNTLVAPLMYSSNSEGSSGTNNQTQGLQAQDQLQQAANFIRYSTSAVSPASLMKDKDYKTLYEKAKIIDKNNLAMSNAAQDAIETYLTKLRVFAAQKSVGIGNLYYILAKRIPQTSGDSNNASAATSQALNEFTMATWRLYNNNGAKDEKWINQINQASPATIQKEMVTLLAEINYQLYLTRQQQERMLLTNSMLLLLSEASAETSLQIKPDLMTMTQ